MIGRTTAALLIAAALHSASARAEPPHVRAEIKWHHTFAADLREEILSLPVTVTQHDGRAITDNLLLTHFRPEGPGPFPILLYSHGRGPDRGEPSRVRPSLARYWVRRGFAVLVPTRLGYGATAASMDPEGSPGGCALRRIAPQIRVTITQINAVLDWAKTQPWADASRVILAGGSLGGYTAVIALGEQRPGVIAAINYSGGSGGNPKTSARKPCRPELVAEALASAAPRVRQPSLWLYSENDLYWGPQHPRDWHKAFEKAGGRGEFHMLPPVGEDGHNLMSQGFSLWRPIADRFLSGLGFPTPASVGAPPATTWARLDDVSRLPHKDSPSKTAGYQRFLTADIPRAFAVGAPTAWALASGDKAMERALELCRKNALSCQLYAVDDAVVWTAPPPLPNAVD